MNKPRKQIQIKFEDIALVATLNDSKASRDFMALLPMNLTLKNLFEREKYTRLPCALDETGQQMEHFETGDLTYWCPGPGITIFYDQGGMNTDTSVARSEYYLLGKIESDIKYLNIAQELTVKIEIFHNL